ncbi:hypothetical protein [Burkholderia sp. PAMC 28687]|uniref:hypothetical protein n=1 Tax=Burkholderia sp. PAMC 28687 TaxID=1795874 RepID=UPI0012D7A70E|nr:hypothetical protein [Burkholderia sp. PAMC 28687]
MGASHPRRLDQRGQLLIPVAIAKKRGAKPGIGVARLSQRLGVFLSTPAIRQKSDCFQSSTTSAV